MQLAQGHARSPSIIEPGVWFCRKPSILFMKRKLDINNFNFRFLGLKISGKDSANLKLRIPLYNSEDIYKNQRKLYSSKTKPLRASPRNCLVFAAVWTLNLSQTDSCSVRNDCLVELWRSVALAWRRSGAHAQFVPTYRRRKSCMNFG